MKTSRLVSILLLALIIICHFCSLKSWANGGWLAPASGEGGFAFVMAYGDWVDPLTLSLSTDSNSGTAPFSPTLTCTITSGTEPYTYTWDFGDGTTDSDEGSITHTYLTSGSYTATVTVTDGSGQTTSQSVQITVEDVTPLSISLTTDSSSGVAPLQATFSCTIASGNAPYEYAWDFGDGTFSSESSPLHAYTDPGSYMATVTVTDSIGQSASGSVDITVEAPPAIPLSADQYIFFASPGDAISMAAHGGNGVYYWLVSDSDSGGYFDQNGQQVSLFAGSDVTYHVPRTPGIYVVTLSDGTSSKQITVDSRTPTSLTISPDTLTLTTSGTASIPLVIANVIQNYLQSRISYFNMLYVWNMDNPYTT